MENVRFFQKPPLTQHNMYPLSSQALRREAEETSRGEATPKVPVEPAPEYPLLCSFSKNELTRKRTKSSNPLMLSFLRDGLRHSLTHKNVHDWHDEALLCHEKRPGRHCNHLFNHLRC